MKKAHKTIVLIIMILVILNTMSSCIKRGNLKEEINTAKDSNLMLPMMYI